MKNIKTILSVALMTLCLLQTADAEWYESKTFDEINMSGMQVGDKLFSNFSVINYTDGVLAVAPSAGSIQVTGVFIDGHYGIRFNAPWIAGSEAIVNSTISFQVSVMPGSDQYISGNTFALTASNVGSAGGLISAVETVWDAEPGSAGAHRLSSLGLIDTAEFSNQLLSDSRGFYVDGESAQLKEIWIKKDITLLGGSEGQSGVTHLSEFTQTFVQIPEPASMGMLGSGVIIALLRRSRSNRQRRKRENTEDFSAIDSVILAGSQWEAPAYTSYAYTGRVTKKQLPKF